jgi:hypothetical protein
MCRLNAALSVRPHTCAERDRDGDRCFKGPGCAVGLGDEPRSPFPGVCPVLRGLSSQCFPITMFFSLINHHFKD